jgi:hypothetical protein
VFCKYIKLIVEVEGTFVVEVEGTFVVDVEGVFAVDPERRRCNEGRSSKHYKA